MNDKDREKAVEEFTEKLNRRVYQNGTAGVNLGTYAGMIAQFLPQISKLYAHALLTDKNLQALYDKARGVVGVEVQDGDVFVSADRLKQLKNVAFEVGYICEDLQEREATENE